MSDQAFPDEEFAPLHASPSARPAAVDVREFIRFVVTGVVATVGNLGTVWLVRDTLPFQAAVLVGIGVGFCISFIVGKLFAFRSRSWGRARGELARFLAVYATGVAVNWTVSMLLGLYVLPGVLGRDAAEMLAAFVGAGTMTFTSYFGHRFFTYRHLHL